MGYVNMVTREKYISFMERLIWVTHAEPFMRDDYVELIHEMCEEYKLAKGDTEFYPSAMMEQRGEGKSSAILIMEKRSKF